MSASPWLLSDRFDPAAAAVADLHYNRRKPGTPQFVPPAACLVLKLPLQPGTGRPGAVWVTTWPLPEFAWHEYAGAWVNTLFRHEGTEHRASDLIRWAVAHTRAKWPEAPARGMVTFVDPRHVRGTLPGYCYKRAGWRHIGYTRKRHLWVWQQLPHRMPDPDPVAGSQGALW